MTVKTRAALLTTLALPLLLFSGAALARRQPRAEVKKSGKLRNTRNINGTVAVLTVQDGNRFLLVGPLGPELRRISGHEVTVVGRRVKKKLRPPAIKVRIYTIDNSGGGHKPIVGRLYSRGKSGVRIVNKDGSHVVRAKAALTRRMRRKLGCKVWVAGERSRDGRAIKAYKFGWLTCKKRPRLKQRGTTRVKRRR